jgi:formylglycine-generating enzyme required for sulfatase activity
VTATAAIPPTGDTSIALALSLQKLSGFDGDGQPRYTRSAQERILSFDRAGDMTLPLLIPDPREKAAFGVHDVLVQLRGVVVGQEAPAAYGHVSVSTDVPGARLLLDGGFAGQIEAGTPTLLQNVLTGSREIVVRDFSGREARQQIVVTKGDTVTVHLEILDLPSAEPRPALVPLGANLQGHEEYWRVKDRVMLVRIPAGETLMGSPDGEGEPPERPQHRVHVSTFLIDKSEVTWRQFRTFAEATGEQLPPAPIWGTPDNYPVSFVLWEEAKRYCEWVGGRLPTEAEWEKAARGTDGRTYPWGNQWDARRCNSISGGLHAPESVGSYPECVSPYGVLDISGSMWEWCADWYGESYYAESPDRDPPGPADGHVRVIRGGGWMSQPLWLRAAYRFKAPTSTRKADHGFRCVQEAPAE